jgi:hypothetical protein
MDDSERYFWLGLCTISGFVVTLLIVGPATRAYTKWKTKRAFRARRMPYRKR